MCIYLALNVYSIFRINTRQLQDIIECNLLYSLYKTEIFINGIHFT